MEEGMMLPRRPVTWGSGGVVWLKSGVAAGSTLVGHLVLTAISRVVEAAVSSGIAILQRFGAP
jgi:hypothetical protein